MPKVPKVVVSLRAVFLSFRNNPQLDIIENTINFNCQSIPEPASQIKLNR